jgi:hypothetical protein
LRRFGLGDAINGLEGAASGKLVPIFPGSRLLTPLPAAGSAIENAGDAVVSEAKGVYQTAFVPKYSVLIRLPSGAPLEVCLLYPLFRS